MFPELFEIPFTHLTVKAYGTMMVIGFLLAMALMRHCARRIKHNPDHITNVALYALITGVIGSRFFYVMHNFDSYKGDFFSIFAVWKGGLEFIGGVLLAIAVVIFLLKKQKLPIRTYMDFLAIGLMLGLSAGRMGCYLNGCCFGKPTDAVCSVTFPYGSPSYMSQAYPDQKRDRPEPLIQLPAEFFGYLAEDGQTWIAANESNKYSMYLKPYEMLTDEQKQRVKRDYQQLHIHPTQFYSTANALILCAVLYSFWRKFGLKYPGRTFALMFILYGPTRFFIETLRDDNPFEKAWWAIYKGGTISQNIGIYLVIIGVALMLIFPRFKAPNGKHL